MLGERSYEPHRDCPPWVKGSSEDERRRCLASAAPAIEKGTDLETEFIEGYYKFFFSVALLPAAYTGCDNSQCYPSTGKVEREGALGSLVALGSVRHSVSKIR